MKLLKSLLLLLVFAVVPVQGAFASLLISPLQVVIEGRERFATISLVNNSNEEKTYRIEWHQFMQVDKLGGYVAVDNEEYVPDEFRNALHLKDFAVYSPRQVTLQPREKQSVRIAVRRPAELDRPEYMSHIKFKVLDTGRSEQSVYKDQGLGTDTIRLGARVNASFSIPVVYRVGEYDVSIDIQKPSFDLNPKTGKMIVSLPVKRAGEHGVIGLIELYHTPNGGSEELIGALSNANMFSEIFNREFKIPTQVSGLNPGTLRIVFNKNEGREADKVVLDELLVPISN